MYDAEIDDRRRPTFGFLLFGLLLGFGAGMAVAKHNHGQAVLAVIAGLFLGPIAGAVVEAHYVRRRARPPDES